MLRRYGPGDLGLQQRLLGDAGTMAHLGGAEAPDRIRARHERSLAMTDPDDGLMLVIEAPDGTAAGSIGYWTRQWRDRAVWETGWLLLPEHRGRGLAREAVQDLLAELAGRPAGRPLHAFPSVDNAASNALCAATGFALVEEVDFEYPKGHAMRCNDWQHDLGGSGAA